MKTEQVIAILGEIRQMAYDAESSPEIDKIYRLAGEALLTMVPERQEAPKAPKLHRIVPHVPTAEMMKAAAQHITNGDDPDEPRDHYEVSGRLLAIYRAMLDAAPDVPSDAGSKE